MIILELPWLSITEVRYRLSRGSSLVHTLQLQATTGTPVEVPVPRKVIFILVVLFGTGRGCFEEGVGSREVRGARGESGEVRSMR